MKNFISKNKFKHFFLLSFLLILYILTSAVSYTNAVCSNISDSVFRLHVIANSDTLEDQSLKYIVRDNIIEYINTISKNCTSKEEVIKITRENISIIESIALDTIRKEGFNYSVQVSIGNFPFPTKEYGDIKFPPGYYDALKIEIGQATGKNWWCVMFPPLCFVDTTSGIVPNESKEIMKNNINDEEFDLISEANTNIKIKFKIIEVLQNFSISGIFM